MTAVEWLGEELKSLIPKSLDILAEKLIEQAKKIENQKLIEIHDKGFDSVKQLNDEYAIEFAEWIRVRFYDNGSYWIDSNKDDNLYTSKELLEIFKKEKGL